MSFQFSPYVDKNKIFLVKYSQLKGRLDTVFYHPKYRANEEAIKNSKWGYEKVSHIARRIADGLFGSDLKVDEYQPEGNPLLRVSNIRTGEVEGDLVYISDEKQEQLKRSKVYPNDVLLTKAGAVLGYSAVFPESLREGNITSHLVTITCRNGIDPHYLSHFFRSNVGQLQIYRWGNKSTRPELNTSEVESILVTTPPPDVQSKIVERLNAAYTAKKQKEAEAQRSLDNIENYLLNELCIDLLEPEENTIQNRVFYRKLSEVSGSRSDATFYKPKYTLLMNNIRKSPHDKLVRIVKFSSETWDKKSFFDVVFPYIEIGEIDLSIGEISTINNVRVEDAPSRARMVVRGGDILISTTRPNRGAIVEIERGEEILIASTGFSIIREILKKGIDKRFLFYILRQSISLKQMEQRSSGGNYPAITQEELYNILIPCPPLEKQLEIVDRITAIRKQAKQLRQAAAAELEQAKQEVEAMILG